MKKVLIGFLMVLFFASVSFAQLVEDPEQEYNDNSVEYVIDTGDGMTVVIFGDGNSVMVNTPPDEPEAEEVFNQIYLKGEVWIEISGPTEIEIDGIKTYYKRIIKQYNPDGTWGVVWSEQ